MQISNKWVQWRIYVVLTTLCILAAVPVHAAGFLEPLGPVAAGQRSHLVEATLLTLVAVLPVLIGVPLIFWRYRRGKANAAYKPGWSFNRKLEMVIWGVPVAIVLVLGVLLWRDSHWLAPERQLGSKPLIVEGVGLNWKWLFLYPDGQVASLGELVIPAGQPVTLKLTSDTVMQSFMVPSIAGQIYAMPGMITRLNIEADKPGLTYGRNMQYSGNGFAAEHFRVRIVDSAGYKHWLTRAAKNPVRLDDKTYAKLAAPGSLKQARDTLAVKSGVPALPLDDINLFERIVSRYQGATAIPPAHQPGTKAYRPEGDAL